MNHDIKRKHGVFASVNIIQDMYEEQDISERRITIQDSNSGERISVRYNGQGIDKGVKASAKVLPHTSWGYIISVEDVR